MVMVYADTSFLFSLILHDANTAGVCLYLKKHPVPIQFTAWQQCELHNAVRLSVWKGGCNDVRARQALKQITADIKEGNLVEAPLIWPEMLSLADEIGERHTVELGVRTLDLLHVAAALSVKATIFLTCDQRQLSLARAVGLRVPTI